MTVGFTTKAPRDESTNVITEHLAVCGLKDGAPACTSRFDIGEHDVSASGGGQPGADGLEVKTKVRYELGYKLVGGVLTIQKVQGEPDDPSSLGRYRLR